MKVLVVCSYNSGNISTYVREQVESLRRLGIDLDYYKIKGEGIWGYLENLLPLRKKIKDGSYDLIHSHYGYSGLLSNFQRIVPVITTYHGSDVHFKYNRKLSLICSRLSQFNLLTNSKQIVQLKLQNGFYVLPCGIDTNIFVPKNKKECRREFRFHEYEDIILFSSSFDRKVKNYELANKAIGLLDDVRLIELKGYSRSEVVRLINASDAVLITSKYETGPLIAKEALACNTPIVSTDVGDIKDLIQEIDNCYITSYDPKDIAEKITSVLEDSNGCSGRHIVEKYDLEKVAKSIKKVYKRVLSE